MCTRQFAWQENECGSQVSLVGVAIVKISTFHTPPKPKPNPKLPCRNVQKYAGHVFYNGGAGRYSSASPDTVLPAVEAGKSPMLCHIVEVESRFADGQAVVRTGCESRMLFSLQAMFASSRLLSL